MRKRTIAIIGGVAVLAAAWGVFRPERLFITTRVDERFPAATADAAARPLLSGAFRGLAHETAGTATVHRLADGRRVLRLTGFRTSNGPDVRVYLVAAPDAPDNETVKKAGFVELGKLKGTEGDQNYDVPAEIDLGRYRSVSIWCARFGVNFGAAPLAPAPGAQAVQGGSHGDQRPL